MIAQQLEQNILSAIEAALVAANVRDRVHVLGVWQPSAVGVVKGQEDPTIPATLAVATGTMRRGTFSTGICGFNGAVSLVVRLDLDPTGTVLIDIGSVLEDLFTSWQGETYQRAFTDLDVPGKFQVGDITFEGGRPPSIDFAAKTVTVDWPFTLSGGDTPS